MSPSGSDTSVSVRNMARWSRSDDPVGHHWLTMLDLIMSANDGSEFICFLWTLCSGINFENGTLKCSGLASYI